MTGDTEGEERERGQRRERERGRVETESGEGRGRGAEWRYRGKRREEGRRGERGDRYNFNECLVHPGVELLILQNINVARQSRTNTQKTFVKQHNTRLRNFWA